MCVNRRQFLLLTTTFVSGCGATALNHAPASTERVVNAGPASKYVSDGVYGAFRSQGFFLVRRDGKVLAISSICTHKKCTLKVEPDHSFYCPCHGSAFDPAGHVKAGPAKRDLPVFFPRVDERGHLLVTVPLR